MGPIESTVRWAANTSGGEIDLLSWRAAYDVSLEAYRFLHGAAESLGLTDLPAMHSSLWFDIYSEAIEAAEALGL